MTGAVAPVVSAVTGAPAPVTGSVPPVVSAAGGGSGGPGSGVAGAAWPLRPGGISAALSAAAPGGAGGQRRAGAAGAGAVVADGWGGRQRGRDRGRCCWRCRGRRRRGPGWSGRWAGGVADVGVAVAGAPCRGEACVALLPAGGAASVSPFLPNRLMPSACGPAVPGADPLRKESERTRAYVDKVRVRGARLEHSADRHGGGWQAGIRPPGSGEHPHREQYEQYEQYEWQYEWQ